MKPKAAQPQYINQGHDFFVRNFSVSHTEVADKETITSHPLCLLSFRESVLGTPLLRDEEEVFPINRILGRSD
ncbi:MAG TPA: hypothetical protein PKO36_18310, partial [Candidatus Hydrogenedentes bacterium]|nr:hypothetical protein [Candidatus Hydrogenedentota bacterium]